MTRPTPHHPSRAVRGAIALISALAFVVGIGAPASAGGWAIASLDEVPNPAGGETTDIGFRILQHGVTPVDLTEDVGIEIVAADGSSTYFPATLDGQTGHYVATVTFPEAGGSYAWTVHMGSFGPQELGSIDVASPVSPAVAVPGSSVWSVGRWVMLAAVVSLAAVALVDFVSTRRRPWSCTRLSRLGRWCALAAIALGVLTAATWDLGTESMSATPPSAAADPAPDGARLFVVKGCVSCHVGPDTRPLMTGFPELDGAAAWAGTRKAGLSAEEYLTESMLSPSVFISPEFSGGVGPTDGMPSLVLSTAEVDALVAYLLHG